jgi:hypothetical protein
MGVRSPGLRGSFQASWSHDLNVLGLPGATNRGGVNGPRRVEWRHWLALHQGSDPSTRPHAVPACGRGHWLYARIANGRSRRSSASRDSRPEKDENMRIGITARGSTVDELVEHARQAEHDGFRSVWYSHLLMGDPLAAMVLARRTTSSIELGTAVLQTYPCHPLLQANRASAVAAAMDRP